MINRIRGQISLLHLVKHFHIPCYIKFYYNFFDHEMQINDYGITLNSIYVSKRQKCENFRVFGSPNIYDKSAEIESMKFLSRKERRINDQIIHAKYKHKQYIEATKSFN